MDYQTNYSTPTTNLNPSYLGTTTSANSFVGWFQSITWQTWLIIIIVLAILGFNVFYYLAAGTQEIHNLLAPILKLFGNTTIDVTKQVVSTGATGIAGTVNASANLIDTGLTSVQNTVLQPQGASSVPKQAALVAAQPLQNVSNALATTINTAATAANNSHMLQEETPGVEPDYANSTIQTGGQEGWCYIGTEDGYRSCAYVSASDKCVSGDIFPTSQICVNPKLRQ